jgi:CubicO group peptidase (beta-lactamase class C family)
MTLRTMARVFPALLASVALVAGATGEPMERLDGSRITPDEIDQAVTRLIRAGSVTGIGIAVLENRNVAYLKAYGERDTSKHLPLTPDSVMTAASYSKSMFACAVMQLVEENALDLDKPIQAYLAKPLPEYERYSDLASDVRYRKITSRMLLSHTAGFPNLRVFNDGKLNINFEPGSRYAYSGEGIQLLQLVVEEITRKPLHQFMRERVFEPIGMRRTSTVWESEFESDFANGYDERGRSLGPKRRTRADAAGSFETTLADFSRFVEAMAQGRHLSQNARSIMLSPQIAIRSRRQFPTLSTDTTDRNEAIRLSYGLGWGLFWSPSARPSSRKDTMTGFNITP